MTTANKTKESVLPPPGNVRKVKMINGTTVNVVVPSNGNQSVNQTIRILRRAATTGAFIPERKKGNE